MDKNKIWFELSLKSLIISEIKHYFLHKNIKFIDFDKPMFNTKQQVSSKVKQVGDKFNIILDVSYLVDGINEECISIGNSYAVVSFDIDTNLIEQKDEEYIQFIHKMEDFIVRKFIFENFMEHFICMGEIKNSHEFVEDLYKYAFSEKEKVLDDDISKNIASSLFELMGLMLGVSDGLLDRDILKNNDKDEDEDENNDEDEDYFTDVDYNEELQNFASSNEELDELSKNVSFQIKTAEIFNEDEE